VYVSVVSRIKLYSEAASTHYLLFIFMKNGTAQLSTVTFVHTITETEIIPFCVASYNFITSVSTLSSLATVSELNSHTQLCIYFRNYPSQNRATCFDSAAIIGHIITKMCKATKIIPKEASPL
jgi:hypothetical protein